MRNVWNFTVSWRMILSIALLLACGTTVSADEYRKRLLGGLGRTTTDAEAPEMKKSNSHYAIQVMQYIPNDTRRRAAGIEVGKHRVFRSAAGWAEYTSIGLLVEATVLEIITAQIGTVGYFARDSDRNPFGLRASLGMDRMLGDHFFLSGFFRQDVIYDLQRITANSIEAGVGYRF